MTLIKNFLYVLLFVLILSFSYVYAWISNLLEISPSTTTWKYYCNTQLTTEIDYVSDEYAGFEFYMEFNTWALSFESTSVHSDFVNDFWDDISWDKYHAYWSLASNSTSDKEATSFTIQPILVVPYQTSASLTFVDMNGDTPSYDPTYTADGISIWGWGKDTLAGVSNATINFEAYPCTDDGEAPIVYGYSPSGIYWWQLVWPQSISFTMIDWRWSAYGHYRYDDDNKTLGDYTSAPSNVDNQYGVNSSSISVVVNTGAWNVIQALTTNNWNWDATHNALTWDRERRWYIVSFTSPSLNVEEETTITIVWSDNPNYAWETHTWSYSFVFNSPENPDITMVYPYNTEQNLNPTVSPLVFYASDSWAWVDSWTISITIEDVLTGWSIVIYTWKTYNYWDSELTVTLSGGTTDLGWAGWYRIELAPWVDFPENATINISWYAMDLAGNEVSESWSFGTRPSCGFYGCSEILDIYIMWWTYAGGSPYSFTWGLLIATWTNSNSPYPYLTWAENNILMCGFPWAWADLTGNIQIFEWDWETPLTQTYTGHELYVTWLNFTYSNGVFYIEN